MRAVGKICISPCFWDQCQPYTLIAMMSPTVLAAWGQLILFKTSAPLTHNSHEQVGIFRSLPFNRRCFYFQATIWNALLVLLFHTVCGRPAKPAVLGIPKLVILP